MNIIRSIAATTVLITTAGLSQVPETDTRVENTKTALAKIQPQSDTIKVFLEKLSDGMSPEEEVEIRKAMENAKKFPQYYSMAEAVLNAMDKKDGADSAEKKSSEPKLDPNNIKKNVRYDLDIGQGFEAHPQFQVQAKGSISKTSEGLKAKVEDALGINAGKTIPLTVPNNAKELWISYESKIELNKKNKGTITPIGAVFIYADGRTESKTIASKETIKIPSGAEKVVFEFCITRNKPTGEVTVEKFKFNFK